MTAKVSTLTRAEGWEARLAGVIEAARLQPYRLGEHDCLRFACAAIEALVGVDLWPAWRGRYRTRRQALKLLAEFGGGFTESASKLFGTAPAPMGLARRGDVAEYRDKEPHLGVVVGRQVALLREQGLEFVARSSCAHCWRIG